MKTCNPLILLATILVALTAHTLPAQIELVTNGGFETPEVSGTQVGFSGANWSGTGSFGIFDGAGEPFSPLTGQVAFMGASTQIRQTFSQSLAADTTYDISFDLYQSSGGAVTTSITGQIAYGTGSGETSAFIGVLDSNDIDSGSNLISIALPGALNDPVSFSGSFTTKSTIAGSSDNLMIFLNSNLAGAQQLFIDNVSVTAQAIPEPSTVAMTMAALAGLIALRFRRRR